MLIPVEKAPRGRKANTSGYCAEYAVKSDYLRADKLLLKRGLVESRAKAAALISAGAVVCDGKPVPKPATCLPADTHIAIVGNPCPYVSRGGLKLAGAVAAFGVSFQGLVVADLGASTGGFTDYALRHGASHVFAIDVGRDQLHVRLRYDERVTVMEQTNARHLRAGDLPRSVDWILIDASFIALQKILEGAQRIAAPHTQVVALVKPQFEVGARHVSKNGVVRDPSLRVQAVDAAARDAAMLGFVERDRCESPILGPKGNQEVFLWLERRAS